MPPARTGVADYSAAMVEALRGLGHHVNVNSDGDADIYHIGNNPLHRPIHDRALQRPGVVVIHDAVLQHFYLGFDDERRYIDEFVYNYGEWQRGLGTQLWRDRGRSGSDPVYFKYPMLKRIAETARLVVVHNPGAAAMVRSHAPSARIEQLPHLFTSPPPLDPHAVLALRHQWRLPAHAFLFGVFGHLRESKRLATVIAAARKAEAFLLVAGDFVSTDYARTIEPAMKSERIIRVPYLSESDFWTHARAVDACINLRYPSAGETSGIAVRLMGIGKPVIVSASLETSGFPQEICLQVDAGVAEEEMLAAFIKCLKHSPAAARQMGKRAQAHIARSSGATQVATRLVDLVRASSPPNVV
jgi:hypothetical protein